MFNHKNTPEDLVFYWDMDAPNIPNDYRDASAAACIASALYEISTVDVPEPQTYKRMPTGSWKVWLLRLTGLNWERMETSC